MKKLSSATVFFTFVVIRDSLNLPHLVHIHLNFSPSSFITSLSALPLSLPSPLPPSLPHYFFNNPINRIRTPRASRRAIRTLSSVVRRGGGRPRAGAECDGVDNGRRGVAAGEPRGG